MVILNNQFPIVRCAKGNPVPVDHRWLHTALRDAAARAGYEDWWLAEDLGRAILRYLNVFCAEGIIDLDEFKRVVQAALHTTGYDEVAQCFHSSFTTRSVSLVACLDHTSLTGPTRLLENIRLSVESFQASHSNHLRFYDLKACLAQLQYDDAAQGVEAARLSSLDIVSYIRQWIGALKWDRAVTCSVVR